MSFQEGIEGEKESNATKNLVTPIIGHSVTVRYLYWYDVVPVRVSAVNDRQASSAVCASKCYFYTTVIFIIWTRSGSAVECPTLSLERGYTVTNPPTTYTLAPLMATRCGVVTPWQHKIIVLVTLFYFLFIYKTQPKLWLGFEYCYVDVHSIYSEHQRRHV